MYLAVVLLTMLVLPLASIAGEAALHPAIALAPLAGKWFVTWGVGVRLLLAGVRQIARPRFTLESILGGSDPAAETLVRELGVHNLALGTTGLIAVARPAFVEPVAVAAAIFYAVAGVRHLAGHARSANETIAMVSDLFIAVVLAAIVAAIERA